MVNNADYNSAREQAIREYQGNPYAYHNPFERGTKAWEGYDQGWIDAQWEEAQKHAEKSIDNESGQ